MVQRTYGGRKHPVQNLPHTIFVLAVGAAGVGLLHPLGKVLRRGQEELWLRSGCRGRL